MRFDDRSRALLGVDVGPEAVRVVEARAAGRDLHVVAREWVAPRGEPAWERLRGLRATLARAAFSTRRCTVTVRDPDVPLDRVRRGLRAGGLRPVAVESALAAWGAVCAWPHGDASPRQVLVVVGPRSSQIAVIEGGNVATSLSVAIGEHHLDRAVAARMGLDEHVVAARRQRGDAAASEPDSVVARQISAAVPEAIGPLLEELASEVALTLREWGRCRRGVPAVRVVLAGAPGGVPGLDDLLVRATGLAVVGAAELPAIEAAVRADIVATGAPADGAAARWAIVTGLSLRAGVTARTIPHGHWRRAA